MLSRLVNDATLEPELRRLFRWLKDKGLTAVITAERGEGRRVSNTQRVLVGLEVSMGTA